MKKFLVALALGIVLVLALATVASADNGPHGGFNGSTEACASCHRAHQAISADGFLLVAADVWTLCTNCHDGTGAYTNVVDGLYTTTIPAPDTEGKGSWTLPAQGWGDNNGGLFGGGFVNATMLTNFGNGSNEGGLAQATSNLVAADQNSSATAWARVNAYDGGFTVSARAVTSRHNVEGAPAIAATARGGGVSNDDGLGAGTIWGAGPLGGALVADSFTGAAGDALECTSCHDPHGNAGRWVGDAVTYPANAPMPSYRLLKFTPSGSESGAVGTAFEAATEVGAGAAFYWNTTEVWGATPGGAPAIFAGRLVIPGVNGVMVPDATVKWYSVNNLPANDRVVSAYRGRSGSGEVYTAIFAGPYDYMGRYYGYRRPAGTINGPGAGTRISCWSGAAMTGVATDCAGATATTAFDNSAAHDALGYWCATCHDRYLAPGGASRTTDSGDANYHYRHRSAASGATLAGTGTYTCVDCHNAHGTAATASSLLASNASYAQGSVLLKADNRAVCIRCHAGAVNFFNVTTSPTAPMVLP